MATDRRFLRTCTLCSHSFITRCSNAKYCDTCRIVARKISGVRYYAKLKAINDAKPKFTIYFCKRCGSHIKAHGVCTNRRICNACLDKDPTPYGTQLRERRKENVEEVI